MWADSPVIPYHVPTLHTRESRHSRAGAPPPTTAGSQAAVCYCGKKLSNGVLKMLRNEKTHINKQSNTVLCTFCD